MEETGEPLHILVSAPSHAAMEDARRLAENLLETVRAEFVRTHPGAAGLAHSSGAQTHPYAPPQSEQPTPSTPYCYYHFKVRWNTRANTTHQTTGSASYTKLVVLAAFLTTGVKLYGARRPSVKRIIRSLDERCKAQHHSKTVDAAGKGN